MVTEELMEEWEGDINELEPILTVFELLTLFKVATSNDLGPLEPIWPFLHENETPLWHAPFRLSEDTLLQLYQQHHLIRLGLLEIYRNQEAFRLTEKGCVAVSWWLGALEDMGFKHKTLKPRL